MARLARTPRLFFLRRACRRGLAAISIGMPDRVCLEAFRLAEHERLGAPPLARSDVFHAAAGRDRAIPGEDVFRIALLLIAIVTLDEEPVRALAVLAVMAQTNEHPAALQLLAGEGELELALAQRLGGVPVRCPEAAVPQH